MGQGCFKGNRKGKGFDNISEDPSELSRAVHHGDGNKYDEQGRHPGGNIKQKKRRHTKYEEQKDSAAHQGEMAHGQPQKDQDQQIKRYEEELKRKSEKIKQLEAEKNDLMNRKDQDQQIKRYEEELKRKSEKIKQLEAEKNDLMNRLSSEAAIKMTYNNPNITNLSDQDRPTKLSERYAELYDNQWTDAFENLQKNHKTSDTKAIEVLLDILYVSFEKCKEVRKQRETLENCITKYVGAATGDLTVLEVMATLKDANKKNLAKILQDYTKIVQDALQEKHHNELQSVSHYLNECVEICLLMNLHNPSLELKGCLLEENLPFDLTLFKPYTKSGDRIAYMVWPALQLYKDGPLLYRGVAQGTSDSAKGHKDHVIKDQHESKVSDRQEDSKLERDQTSNNDITRETDNSFAEKTEVQVSPYSRNTDKDIRSNQSQQSIETKRRTGYENLNCSSDIVTIHDKGTKNNEEEPKGEHVLINSVKL